MNTPTHPRRTFTPLQSRPQQAAAPNQPLPDFIKKAAPADNVDQLANAARSGMDALTQIIHERDTAMEGHRMAYNELLAARAKNEVLERQLHESNAKLEHYQRLSTGLLTRLDDISTVIEAAVSEARNEAYRGEANRKQPSPQPQPSEPLTVDEEGRLKDLAHRLRPDENPDPI